MKNALMYYYNLSPENIHHKDNIYYFKINDDRYFVYPVLRDDNEIKELFEINMELVSKKMPIHQIILNNQNNILIQFNNTNYVLLKSSIRSNRIINFSDIIFIENNTPVIKLNSNLNKSNWIDLWSKKNDYLEYQISQFGINYPLVVEHFAYYIGLAENAIVYAKNSNIDSKPNFMDSLVICHKRINNNTSLFDLLNPLEFVIDHKVRDIAEYIKFKFFYDKANLWDEINIYFNNNNLSEYGIRLLYARLLYPTYFFDKYDEVLNGIAKEKELITIIQKQEEYEEFLADMYHFFSLKYNIPKIEWLIKK